MNQYFSFKEIELTTLKHSDYYYAFSISEFSLSVKNHITSGEKISSMITFATRISKAMKDITVSELRNFRNQIYIKKFFITIKSIYTCSSPQTST